MKMDFDLESRVAAEFALPAGNHGGQSFDWHGLRARMAAAYAAHAMLQSDKPCETAIDSGSFDRGSARALAVYGTGPGEELDRVNPTALANGNSGYDNNTAAAGANSAGD
jgi:hypothetical protein